MWNVLKIDLANYKNLLDQTKANAKYRAIYIDLKANGLPLPNEDSSHLLKFFNSTDYNINLESVGTGLIDDKVASTEKDDKLFVSGIVLYSKLYSIGRMILLLKLVTTTIVNIRLVVKMVLLNHLVF